MSFGAHLFYARWLPGTGSVVEAGFLLTMKEPGVFKVRSAPDAPRGGKFINIQVAVDSPWSAETTLASVVTCGKHGIMCERLFEDCEDVERAETISRWFPVVQQVDHVAGTFDVEVWQLAKCETLEEAKKAPPPQKAEAGFFLQAMMEKTEPVG